jgi:hypothetical protein
VRLPWKRLGRGRLFEVECECGEIFRVPFDPDEAGAIGEDSPLLPLRGECPWCGLRLERIEPFGASGRSG